MLGRIAFETVALFLAPFVLFAIYLILRARYPLEIEHWTRGRVSWLTLAGVALALVGLIGLEILAPRGRGVYVPAHNVNGVLVPGHFE
jgi:hypothetical protein